MSPVPATNSSTPSTNSTNSTTVNPNSASADQTMFLQLLVTQLQNQDPLNPTDSTQFVSELAQFQQLQSTINMGQDVTDIRTDTDQLVTATGGTATGDSQTAQPSTQS